ncbi:unnamed protein product [Sympodiomycopsis kandeliae]
MSRQSMTDSPTTGTSSPSLSSLHYSLPPLRSNATSNDASTSSLVTIHAMNLSLPHPPQSDPYMDSLPYQLLLSELPHVLRHSTKRSVKRRRKLLDEMNEEQDEQEQEREGEEDEIDNELEHRLESIGSSVGANLAERLSRDRPPLSSTLDILKFLCKDFWISVWDKQVDGLRTNHKGVYVLSDHSFKPLLRISITDSKQLQEVVKLHLPFSVGLLRGALNRLGVQASVVAESALINNSAAINAPSAKDGSTSTGAGNDQVAAVTFHVRTAAAAATSSSSTTPMAGVTTGTQSGRP